MAYRDTVLLDSPADFYEMETSTGTDSGSGARTLTLSNVTTGVNGIVGKGWSYNGTTSSASMASFPGGASVANLTLEVWVKAPSNAGWSNDYQTFVRRNGTDIVLIRGRGSNITGNVNPGKAEVFLAGTTILSTNRIDDGNWHHVVLTVAGTAAKLYIDGSLSGSATTSKSTYNFGTAAAFVGSDLGTGEFYKGSLDNVAVYTTALTATKVTDHYNAAFVTGGYTGQAMTATGDFPGGYHPVARLISGEAMTASASMPDAKASKTVVVALTRDASSDGLGTTAPNPNLSTGILIDFTLPSDFTTQGLVKAELRVTTNNTASTSMTVKQVAQEWTSGATYSGTYGPTLTTSTYAAGSSVKTIDVTSILTAENFYGLRVAGNGTLTTEEGGYSSNLTLSYAQVSIAGGYTAQPLTVTATMPDASVGIARSIAAEPFLASASTPDATVVGERYYTYTAEPFSAAAETGQESTFALPVTTSATVFVASAQMPTASIGTAQGVVYYADAMTTTASWIRPALVNGQAIVLDESEDKYFQRVFGLAPSVYQRLADKGSIALDRMGTYNGKYFGVQVGKFDAPDGRHSVHFPLGSYLEQNEPEGSNQDEAWIQDGSALATTLEFSFRTDKSNTFLMAGADSTQTNKGIRSSYAARELFLTNGRLTFRSRIFAGTPDAIDKEFSGTRNLADGKWHTVVIKSGVYSRGEWGVELYVDGTFEVRRFNSNGFMGFPDYIGFRPSYIDGSELEILPLSQGFEGDMTEVAFYNHNNLASHDIARNYYAFMGWAPVFAEPLSATATFGDHKGKGSQKRALLLYWTGLDEVFGGLPGKTGQPVEESISFDPMTVLVADSYNAPGQPRIREQVGDYHGYKVFSKSVTRNYTDAGVESYRDPITDDQSIINLESDVDLSDYDLIMFKDWPDEGYELDTYESNYPGQKDRLVRQLLEAQENGTHLFITNPRLATDLGIIDRIEFVPTLVEHKFNNSQGAAIGLYDYGTALKFPWNITASDGLTGNTYAQSIGVPQILSESYLENKAYYYHDTNANNRFRVRAVIEGLTDLPSYMVQEAVFHVDYDFYGWQGVAYKYLKRESGLLIGDEYIFYGSEDIAAKFLNDTEKRYGRYSGTWATPNGHVKAGTVVTTFGAKHYQGKVEVDNPYKDYATTIVLKPGDNINGRPVGARIFVNFTEQPSYGLGVAVQEIPNGSTGWPQGYPVETSAQREWDYSWTRTSLTTTSQEAGGDVVNITLPNGDTQTITVGKGRSDLAMVRSNQLFPVTGKARMEMTGRGMYWIAAATPDEEGAVIIRATPMEATASMPEPVTVARKRITVNAQPMYANASMPRVAEDNYGDVVIRPLPMFAEASLGGYSKTISVAPMLATAEFVEPFDAVHTSGDQITLTLHSYDATLYLKEEA